MMEALLSVGVAIVLSVIAGIWKISKAVGDLKEISASLKAGLAEIRRDVDRHEGLHTDASKSREKQGERIGGLEARARTHEGVCGERHKVPTGGTV